MHCQVLFKGRHSARRTNEFYAAVPRDPNIDAFAAFSHFVPVVDTEQFRQSTTGAVLALAAAIQKEHMVDAPDVPTFGYTAIGCH
jgi:hypothetical protein